MRQYMKTNTFLVISSLCVFLAFASAGGGECGPGYYTSGSGSCKKCPKGTFQDEPRTDDCKPCPDGTVSMEAGSTECTKCGENKEPTEFKNSCSCIKGSILEKKSGKCVLCEPGTRFFPKGRGRCFQCHIGQYQPLAGQMDCLECPKGSTSIRGAKECTSCPEGERLIDGVCGTCPAGEYFDSSFDSETCSGCRPGTFKAKAGFAPCIPCPPNTSSKASASKCVASGCPEGEAPMRKGKCGKCPAGTHYDPDRKRCYKCDKNYFMPYESIATECFECAGTSFTKKAGAKECFKCPLGKFLLKSGKCGTCRAGFYYDHYDQKCLKCGVNEYSTKSMDYCEECPKGSYALPGASTCFACPIGQALIGKKCGVCPVGQYYDEIDAECEECFDRTISAGGIATGCKRCPADKKSNDDHTECVDK